MSTKTLFTNAQDGDDSGATEGDEETRDACVVAAEGERARVDLVFISQFVYSSCGAWIC